MTSSEIPSASDLSGVRGKALTSARKILASRGADELSLRAIAEDAGIGIASIYHYFANKEELLLNLAIMGFADLNRHIANFQTKPELGSPMQASARAFFDFAEKQPALFSLMFSERLLSHHETLREAEHKTLLAYQAAVAVDGRIPPQHQANVSYALWALGRGIAAIISSFPAEAIPPDVVAKLFAGSSYLINHPD